MKKRMKNSKRIISSILAAAMMTALAGCGQKSGTAQETSAQTQETAVTAQETEARETEAAETKAPETAQEAPETENQKQAGEEEKKESSGGTLVVYFSATGNTKDVAGYIAESLDGELYEIVPQEPYTSDDLDWTDDSSRVSTEHEDPDFRPAIAGEAVDLSSYDTIFLGYPIWWGEAPNIVRTFMEQTDLSGKTVIPFCTSSSSGLGSSAETLKAFAPDADWMDGQRFPSRVSEEDVAAWVDGLGL